VSPPSLPNMPLISTSFCSSWCTIAFPLSSMIQSTLWVINSEFTSSGNNTQVFYQSRQMQKIRKIDCIFSPFVAPFPFWRSSFQNSRSRPNVRDLPPFSYVAAPVRCLPSAHSRSRWRSVAQCRARSLATGWPPESCCWSPVPCPAQPRLPLI
jgi:hypothetical protein